MPTTRSQAAEDKTLRVYDDYPASPSVQASASVVPSEIPRPIARTIAMEPNTPVTVIAERRSRAPSVHSHRSTASVVARIRQAELDAEEQLAEIRRQELRLQATLLRKKLAANIANIREETDRESVAGEEAVDTDRRISDWLQRTQIRGEHEPRALSPRRDGMHTEQPPRARTPEHGESRRPRSPTPHRSREQGIDRLANTLEQMMRRRAPPRQTQDLPQFSGAAGEWLPFKAAMRESTTLHGFTPAENLARLRTCLKGEARQAVSALLYTATDPSKIMQTLEQSYGRPEVIIDQALEDLRKLPRAGTSAGELNGFAVKLQNIVTIISRLDNRGYLMNPMLTRQVIDKLSPHMRTKWCDYAEEYMNNREPEIVTLSKFLMREADRAVRYAYTPNTHSMAPQKSATTTKPEHRTRRIIDGNRGANVFATVDTPDKDVCFCCGANHRTPKCHKLAAMPITKRWEWAKETRLCFRCLDSRHQRFRCQARKCGVDECAKPHHALLHMSQEKEESVAAATMVEEEQKVLLKICPITVRGPGGDVDTYALFDEGSTVTLVDKEIALSIGARGTKQTLTLHGITSTRKGCESETIDIEIRGRGQREYQRMKARTIERLSLNTQSVTPATFENTHLRDLNVEHMCYSNARPRVLIGTDNWHLIVSRQLLIGARGQPAASLTLLGWIVHGTEGRPKSIVSRDEEAVLHIRTAQETQRKQPDDRLEELIKAHYDVDALGITRLVKPVEKDERAKAIVERTIVRVNERFEVGLPWASDTVRLPPSYDMAVRRLRSIERKMDSSPRFKEAYTAQVEALLRKGYAELSRHSDSERLWFLPHFAVFNANKPEKLRMVFDAAARANNTCLNDALLDGPDLLRTLYGVLFRFREKPVAVTADIREMFLQIKIRKEDRVAQHFVWRGDDRSHPPKKYVMTSMVFGARSSPFLAHSVRNRNADDHKETHPLAHEAIVNNHYMDDWVDSFESEEVAALTIQEVRTVHRKAGFELAGWSSNVPQLLQGIPPSDRSASPKRLGANIDMCGKTLGLMWLTDTDQLGFNTAMHKVPEEVKMDLRTPTKREALSAVMSIFDPLGLISPYTVTAKIMLQELWKQKMGWDEDLPEEEATKFREWKADLAFINELRLPRCYLNAGKDTRKELHVFCDASEQAYAVAAYWRAKGADGSIGITLVAGKAKVAPLKPQTIPRLELQACLVGARLAQAIIQEHRVEPQVTFWTDSKTVLHWIKGDSTGYAPYVAHRIGEIAELTKVDQWRWVPTRHNVADDATRMGKTKLRSNDRWFVGPSFLYKPETKWEDEPRCDNENPREEAIMVVRARQEAPLVEVERFSSYRKLVRVTVIVLKAVDKWRRRDERPTLETYKEAENRLIRQAQRDSFPEEIDRLREGRAVARSSRLGKLDPKYGDDRIIRLNGRINAAMVPEIMKEPPILDGSHPITRLIITDEHKRLHTGQEQVVNSLRQKYWIIGIRPAVKRIMRKCVTCALRRASPVTPVKGNLPEFRLGAYTRPFSRCGIDCFGPMWVTIGRRREKRWGMLLTCLVTRAIHIEVVASLSTDSVIMAIRRMAARRGWPETIVSDNGTNFRGASVELATAYREWIPTFREFALSNQIDWRFIDPGAPNQGGVWERLIRSVKSALAIVLNERAPKEEILVTTLAEIEHTVNSRPLTHVPVDPEDMEALTPNHFLLGNAIGLPYVGQCEVADKRTWRAAQALANMFWERWLKEYLPTLTPRGDNRGAACNVKPGDVVIIADGLLPRNVWPRGQVEKVHLGPDNVVRSVEVRTRGGVFRRPVRRLIVLPLEKGCEDLRRGEDVTDDEPE